MAPEQGNPIRGRSKLGNQRKPELKANETNGKYGKLGVKNGRKWGYEKGNTRA